MDASTWLINDPLKNTNPPYRAYTVTPQDIELAQLILGRGVLTLPHILQIFAQVQPSTSLSDYLLTSKLMDKETLTDLKNTLAKASPTQKNTLLEQGQTLVLNQTRQRHTTPQTTASTPRSGRYDAQEKLGHGGMGQVWQVYDNVMGRRVAMKSLHTKTSMDPARQQQLFMEAKVTGRLEHPSIIPIYDVEHIEGQEPFYTMRIVKQPSLKSLLKHQSDITTDHDLIQLVTILHKTLLALEYAHVHGVVHRDIKPANILVGRYGEVFIIDWGVAKIDNTKLKLAEFPKATLFIEEGSLIGTPRYMSPEQAQGKIEEIDGRTDVYAVGVILYEILTQTPFFEAPSTIARLYMAAHGIQQTPSERRPDLAISPQLESICLKALQTDPQRRYTSAGQMATALEAYITGIQQQQMAARRAAQTLVEAHQTKAEHQQQRQQYQKLTQQRDTQKATMPPHAPMALKQSLWNLEQQLIQTEQRITKTFHDAVRAYQQTLTHDPNNQTARRCLADLHYLKLKEAEAAQDNLNINIALDDLKQYDDGHYHAIIHGKTQLAITLPTNINGDYQIRLWQYIDQYPLFSKKHVATFSNAPPPLELSHGSYILEFTADNYHDVTYPLLLKRLQTHTTNHTLPHRIDPR